MPSNCRYCKAEITWEQKDDKWTPLNVNGSKHDCRKKKEDGDKPQKAMSWNRFTGFKGIKEVVLLDLDKHLNEGWIIIDAKERTGFEKVNKGTELQPIPETVMVSYSVYIIGLR